MITFETSRGNAYRLLGDAADEIRAGDWQPAPTPSQRDAILKALHLIGQAKDALNDAARADLPEMRYPTGRPGFLGEYQSWPCGRCGGEHDDSARHECTPKPA